MLKYICNTKKSKKTKSIKTPEKNSIKKLFSCCCLKQAFYGLSAMTSFVLAMLSFRIFMNLLISRWNRKAQHLLRASLRCIKSIFTLRIVQGFKFHFWSMQINMCHIYRWRHDKVY